MAGCSTALQRRAFVGQEVAEVEHGIVEVVAEHRFAQMFHEHPPDRAADADDYLSELPLKGRATPALASLDRVGRVIHIGSFSKTLTPALRRLHLFLAAQSGPLHRGFHDTDGFVKNLERDGVGMAVLAAMGEREPRRVAETVGRAMHDFRDHPEELTALGERIGFDGVRRECFPRPPQT